jgi:hypothetical protein
MELKEQMYLKKEKIFLCKKVKRKKNCIFDICKIKKDKKINENDLSFISTNETQTQINDNNSIKKECCLLYNQILVPSFLNDIIQSNIQIQEKLKKYNEISYQFKDKEEAEIYLITKSSIISDELINEKLIKF